MRKYIIISITAALVAGLIPAWSQEHLSERVYISTDRDVYVAGEDMFVSAFCLDRIGGGFSDGSRTVYLEIVSADGPVQTAKLALDKGRGGGVIQLQNTIPTGEYRLAAYTSQCFNEVGYNFLEGARTLAIINPFTTARAASGVEILSEQDYLQVENGNQRPTAGGISIDTSGPLRITNNSGRAVTLSVSIYNDDGIPSPGTVNPVSFLAAATTGSSFVNDRSVDFEGEIVRTRLVSAEQEIAAAAGRVAFLGVPGRIGDLYSARIEDDGTATFYTRNIYGNTDLVLAAGNSSGNSHLEILSPFADVTDPDIPALPLSQSIQDKILLRSMSMQVQRATDADSLYSVLPIPDTVPFKGDSVVYELDAYTRFPLMEELFIEYISEVSFRRTPQGRELVVFMLDDFRPVPYESQPCLVLLDGIPVLDHNVIFDYDPLLVERIVIYPNTYFLGGRTYQGIINFKTYRGDLPSYTFESNDRVVEFKGVSYPVVSWLPDTSEDVPDLRQTILWHPLIDLAPGESKTLDFCLPSYEGIFKVAVEGFDSEGKPQCASGLIAFR